MAAKRADPLLRTWEQWPNAGPFVERARMRTERYGVKGVAASAMVSDWAIPDIADGGCYHVMRLSVTMQQPVWDRLEVKIQMKGATVEMLEPSSIPDTGTFGISESRSGMNIRMGLTFDDGIGRFSYGDALRPHLQGAATAVLSRQSYKLELLTSPDLENSLGLWDADWGLVARAPKGQADSHQRSSRCVALIRVDGDGPLMFHASLLCYPRVGFLKKLAGSLPTVRQHFVVEVPSGWKESPSSGPAR